VICVSTPGVCSVCVCVWCFKVEYVECVCVCVARWGGTHGVFCFCFWYLLCVCVRVCGVLGWYV